MTARRLVHRARFSRRPTRRDTGMHALCARRGFSMPELLVTIGTILVLVALLMPAIGRIRTQGKIVVCSNNLRQIGEGMNTWKVKHDPVQMPAAAWRSEMSRYAGFAGKPIFYCPEQTSQAPGILMSNLSLADGIQKLTPTPGTPGDPGDPGDGNPPPPPQGPLILYFRNGPSEDFDGNGLELRPGPWVKKEDRPDGYTLHIEDAALSPSASSSNNIDFDDFVINVTNNPDGTQSLHVVSGSNLAGGGDQNRARYDLLDASGNVLVSDFADRDNPSSFDYGPFLPPPPGNPGSPGDPGTPGSSDVEKGTGGYDYLLAKGDSDYAINVKSNKVWGKSDKVMFLDYRVTIVADPSSDGFIWDTAGAAVPAIARHAKHVNVLYGDGSVRLTSPESIDVNDPLMTRRSWAP